MNAIVKSVGAGLFMAGTLRAQGGPSAAPPATAPGKEIVAVFVSMASCCAELTPELLGPVADARKILRIRATEVGASFRMVGLALDWKPEDGWAYLKQFGNFDEVSVGSNWFGLSAEALLWADTAGTPVVPELVVFEREVDRSHGVPRPVFGPRKVLKTLQGASEIVAWLRAGAPLT